MKSFIVMCMALGCSVATETASLTHDLQNNQCSSDPETGECVCMGSPIVLDLAGDGVHLSGPDDGVLFSLRGTRPWLWSWTAAGSDDAWLVLDLDGNGRIDNGSEMFGDATLQAVSRTPNGFLALGFYDQVSQGGNADGKVDSSDRIWSRLRLWRDIDHDGVSQPAELITLDKAHVHSLSLGFSPSGVIDSHGNQFRFSGSIVADAPVASTVYDVWLVPGEVPTTTQTGSGTTADYVLIQCKSWAYAIDQSNDRNKGLNTTACYIASVIDDPVVDMADSTLQANGYHNYVRFVRRWGSSVSDLNAARSLAINSEQAALGTYPPLNPKCVVSCYPLIDPEQPDYPHPDFGLGCDQNIRSSCTSVNVATPPPSGGGC